MTASTNRFATNTHTERERENEPNNAYMIDIGGKVERRLVRIRSLTAESTCDIVLLLAVTVAAAAVAASPPADQV